MKTPPSTYLEDGEHAPGRDVVAVDEAERVGDRVPHARDGAPRSPLPLEPLAECHLVQRTDVLLFARYEYVVRQVRVGVISSLFLVGKMPPSALTGTGGGVRLSPFRTYWGVKA